MKYHEWLAQYEGETLWYEMDEAGLVYINIDESDGEKVVLHTVEEDFIILKNHRTLRRDELIAVPLSRVIVQQKA